MASFKFYRGESMSVIFTAYDNGTPPKLLDISGYSKDISLFTPYSNKITPLVSAIGNNSFRIDITANETSTLCAGSFNIVVKLSKDTEVKIGKSIPCQLLDPYVACGAERLSMDAVQTKIDMVIDAGTINFDMFFGTANVNIDGVDAQEFIEEAVEDKADRTNLEGNQVVYTPEGAIPISENVGEGIFAIEDEAGNHALKIEKDGTTRIPKLVLPPIVLPEIPIEEIDEGAFTVEDEAGNIAFQISAEGESSFSNLQLPTNIMKMIEAKINEGVADAMVEIDAAMAEIDNIINNLASGTGISGDLDAVIYGLSRDTMAKNNLCFIHLSDTHSYQPAFVKMVETANKYVKIVDAVIHSGDIVERYDVYPSSAATIDYMNSLGCPVPIYLTMGNHDKEGTAATPFLTKEEQYNQYIKPNLGKWGASTQENKCYYYKDFAGYGIRYISLDIIDFSDAPTAAPSLDALVTSQAQIDWFINALKDATTKGYSVIVGVHYPMVTDNTIIVSKLGAFNYSEMLILEIVDAFIKGTSLTKSYKSGNSLFPAINVDITFDKAGDFITYLSGHVHRDGRGFAREKQFLKLASAAGDRHLFDTLSRRKDTITEHLMDIVIINKRVRRMYTIRVGAAMSAGWSIDKRNYSFSEIAY